MWLIALLHPLLVVIMMLSFEWLLELPNNLFFFALGNLLGAVVNTTIEGGLEKFLRQPSGCGEQTMISMAPNVYVLDYLINTKQLSGANEENAYRFIQSG